MKRTPCGAVAAMLMSATDRGYQKPMKCATALVALLLVTISADVLAATSGRDDALCGELEEFLASILPDEQRAITLHTYWGAKEEGDRIVIASRSCEHDDYEPGKKLCAYLMENSSTEFPGYNTQRVLACLAPPGLPGDLTINSGSFSTDYGSPGRGALVDIELSPGKEPGGMTLRLKADGY
ncbi:hypothetical protein ABIE51_000488 [Lysobacter sp. OAE881]